MILGIAHARASLDQAWPPFVLVAGLLLIGQLAAADGLYEAAAAWLVRLGGRPASSLLACLALVALVTALLNLDTSAVFLTPVLIGVARRRRIDAAPFLYGAIFMTNASSLFLPGSNLTNLLVLRGDVAGANSLFARLLPSALAATLITAAGLLVIHRRALRAGTATEDLAHTPSGGSATATEEAVLRAGPGLAGVLLAAVLILTIPNPALPVLAVACVLILWSALRGGSSPGRVLAALGLPTLIALFALTLALGIAARSGDLSLHWLQEAGAPATAAVAALLSVLLNNLPAAVLLSAHAHLQARALLIGLDIGPNLAVTGSLAVLLWWRAARAAGIAPSARAYSRQGLVLAPLAGVVALALTYL